MATQDSNSNDSSKLEELLPDIFLQDEQCNLKNDVSWQWHLVTLRKEMEACPKDKIIDVFIAMYNYGKVREIVVRDLLKSELGVSDPK